MGIGIQREAGVGVSQNPRQGFGIHAAGDGVCGEGMPQIMESYRELQLLARQYYQMTSILIKAKVDFNAICDQVLPGMQELMNDHAGQHKLSDFVLRYCHTTHILEMGET